MMTSISKSDIEDCHWLGKSNLIVRFINQKFSKDSGEKFEVKKLIDNSKLGFHVESYLFKLINSLQPGPSLDAAQAKESTENP